MTFIQIYVWKVCGICYWQLIGNRTSYRTIQRVFVLEISNQPRAQLIWDHSPDHSLIVLKFSTNTFLKLFLPYITVLLSLLLNDINYHYYQKQLISWSYLTVAFKKNLKRQPIQFSNPLSLSRILSFLSRTFFGGCLRALWSWCIQYVFFVSFSRHISNTLVYCAFPQLLSWNQLINKIHSPLKELN